ncbi:MAG: hypothetical protein JO182_09055 [Acidobacteriaceae bacterium]|nr:hypothetical protein [Acidobacteriaceae bacterium]
MNQHWALAKAWLMRELRASVAGEKKTRQADPKERILARISVRRTEAAPHKGDTNMRFSKRVACVGGLLAAGWLQGQTAQPGVVRIGVIAPVYTSGAGEALRTLEMQVLKSPNVEVIKLDALMGDCCDYVLASTVSQAKAGGFGGLKGLSALRQMSPMVPGAGLTKAATVLQSAELAANVASVASGITAKSEVTFGYSLITRSGQQVLNQVEKAKAKTDGEDVITPMVQSAAAKILAAAKH